MAIKQFPGKPGHWYDTATKIEYEQAPDGTLNPISTGGAAHVTDAIYDYAPTYSAGGYDYYAKTYVLGSALSDAVWRITRIRTADNQISFAGTAGSFGKFDQVATPAGLAALTYSQT